MGGAHGTKQRIMARNRYAPSDPRRAERKVRVDAKGVQQTRKRRGDLIIDAAGRKHEVKHDTWH